MRSSSTQHIVVWVCLITQGVTGWSERPEVPSPGQGSIVDKMKLPEPFSEARRATGKISYLEAQYLGAVVAAGDQGCTETMCVHATVCQEN